GNLDAKSNTWQITTDASDSPTVSMTDLVGVIGTADLTQSLPLGVAAFSSTQLVAMSFSIGATNAIAPNMTFTVSPNNNASWDIVPGSLSIGTLQLSSTVGRSALQSTTVRSTFYGSISGIITIGRLPFYVALSLTDSNTWVLQVGNKQHPALPALSDLAGLLGESDPTSFLNETMSALKFEPLSQTSITQVTIAFDRFTASLMYVQIGFASRFRGITVVVQIRLPDLSIEAGLDTSTRPSLLTFLQTFDPAIPDPDGALSQTNIAAFAVSAAPQDQTYSLNAQLTSSWTINVPVGGGNPISFNISSLTLDLEAIQNNFGFSIIGIMTLFGQVQLIVAASRPADGGWTFMGSVSTLMPVNLGDLIDHFVNPTLGGQSIDLSGKNLATLDVKQLMVRVQSRADGQKTYAFMGEAAWKAPIGDQGTFEVDAAVSITKPSGQPATGYIQGSLFFKDFFFNNLDIIVRYDFSPTSKSLTFTLRKDGKELSASLSYGPTQDTILTVKLQKITVGDILTFLVNLVDPYLDFKLEAPWDLLNSIDLSSLSLTINLTKRTVGITYTNKIELGFMTITSLTFTYEKVNGQSTVTISLGGNFLGTTYDPANNPLKWDALNDSPPAVPGKGNGVFDLDYLGVGQHVALQDVSKLNTVEQVILALQNTVVPIKTSGKNPIQQLPGLVFNTDSGWLIGAKFSVLNTVAISLVFNDPEVYGLLITLSGEKAKIFAGLKFEILYHKISNTVGVYHIELKLPDAMRHLEFGALSITLPVFVLDIYTNGDFRIDVGFPTNGDFSRSFGVQYFPFVGYGGFYFAKLSSDTSTNVPKITNGTFNPVIEFGLGLSIGVGKEIDKGIFSAGLTVTAQGIFEGVFGWFRPTDTTQPDAQFFKLVATLALVGHLYGKIDFAVIQASVDITVYVAVKATFEVYQPMLIDLVAGVSVKVSVKILFVRIHLSFSTTIRANFVLGSASPTPWHVAGKSPQQLLQPLFLAPEVLAETPEFGLRMSRLDLIATPATTQPPLNWGAFGIWTQPRKLDLLFEPNFTILAQSGSNKASSVAGLALLFIQNAMPAEDSGLAFHELFIAQEGAAEMPFNILVEGILGWAILAYANRSGTPPAPPSSNTCQSATPGSVDYSAIVKQTRVSLADLSDLYTVLVDTESGGKLPFTTPSDLPGFLKTNFCFNLTLSSSNQSATYFPMLPELTMTAGSTTVDFGANPIPDTYLSDVEKFVQTLQVQFENAESGSKSARAEALVQAFADGSSGLSMAGFIFQDYFAIIARSAVQAAIDYLETQSGPVALSDLLAQMRGADAINTIAGMVSRFLLHGLRLPTPKDEQNLQALYLLTGQQFNVPATLPTDYSIQLKADPAITWLQFPSGSTISYNVTTSWGAIIQQLSQATFSPQINSVRALQNYQIDAQRYIFQHQRVWQTASSLNLCATPSTGTLTLWQFPSTLTDALGDAKTLPLDVTLWEATPATSGNTGLDKHQAQCFAWATMVSLGVQQVPSAAATGMLPNIYQLQGTTEEGRMLLEALWPFLEKLPSTTTARLFLLYPQGNTGGDNPALLNDAGIDPLLLKVNLSTQSNPQAALLASDEQQDETRADLGAIDTIYNATFAQATNFVRLVWEASVTNTGGYYLYYQTSGGAGFPDYLFGNGPTAQLSLLIVLEGSDYSKLHSQLQAFHNVVLLADTLSDGQVLYATANQITVKHATIPAGTVGFQIDRTPQPEATLQGRLDELYNLIGYSVAANSFFKASIEGLPVGPTFDQNDNQQAVSDDWRYQRVVPTYPWAINNSLSETANPLLPPADQNPYAGLSAQSTIALAFSYHDTFGNQIAGPPTLSNLSAPVRYIDPLLGITLWPSVAAGYTFTAGDSQSARLNFVLHFDSSKYMPSAGLSFAVTLEKIKSDRFSYQQIYYQIHQPDVTFSLTTTVNNSAPFSLTTADFASLTDASYLYLATLAAFVEEFSYTVPTSSPPNLQTIATTYGVTVGELADQNSTIINIFSAGKALKIPLYYRIVAGQTLETIAQQSGIGTTTLLAQAADDPAFLQPGTVLATGQTLSYTVQGTLALAQIAAQFADVAPGDVAAANAGVVVGVDSLTIRNTPTDSTGKTLNELIAAYSAANPNEPALTAAEIGTANQDLLSFFADTTPLTIPVLHEVLAGETVTIITRIYGITAAALLQHNPNNTRLLNPNVRMLVTAESYSTVAGDTLLTITQKANITIAQHNQSAPLPYELISTADLGGANATVALNPNLGPRADDLSQTVPAPLLIPSRMRLATLDISGYALHRVDGSKDTLASLAAANQNPADLA
ncbi:MAG TPA: LysM peptidoglycan-binding domain-containing protein, partial [Herpetosiphonaceae bacterium]